MPELALDEMIPLCFASIWVYFSFYLLLGMVGLMVEKKMFIQYLYTVGWVTLVSHMVFLFLPTGVMRTEVDIENAPWIYQLLANVDEPRNAAPSLHASLSVVAAMAVQCSTRFKLPVKLFTWLWVIAIFWSTIALRQHVSICLISGSVLAVAVWFIVGRSSEMKQHGV